MGEDRAKDEMGAGNMMKKHSMLENTVEDYAETVRQLGERSRNLIDENHPERWMHTPLFLSVVMISLKKKYAVRFYCKRLMQSLDCNPWHFSRLNLGWEEQTLFTTFLYNFFTFYFIEIKLVSKNLTSWWSLSRLLIPTDWDSFSAWNKLESCQSRIACWWFS